MTITISSNATKFTLNTRLSAELKLLDKVAKTIVVGSKTIGDVQYTAILIKRMPLSSSKFKVSNSDVLFLLGLFEPNIIV